jgi:hypothetical protein
MLTTAYLFKALKKYNVDYQVHYQEHNQAFYTVCQQIGFVSKDCVYLCDALEMLLDKLVTTKGQSA